MKLNYKIILLLVALAEASYSQILVGPVVGGNYSFTTFDNKSLKSAYNVRGVYGFHVGGHLSFKVKKRFFLHSSLIYSTKGRSLDSDQYDDFKYEVHYNFIELPIAYTVDFKTKLGQNREFKYFVGVGPNISYWLNGKGKLSDAFLLENNIQELPFKVVFKERSEEPSKAEMLVERPNRLQFGLNFVGGFVFEPAPRQRIMLTLRYELGHTFMAKSDGQLEASYFQDPLQSRNQGLRLSVAYLYDLKTEDRNRGKSTIDRRNPK